MKIQINPATMQPCHVTYKLTDAANNTLMIHHCRFIDVLKISEAVRNPAFTKDALYTIEILSWHKTPHEAINAANAAIGMKEPPLNLTMQVNHIGAIRCNESGQVFYTQADAVRVLGVNQAQLSQHLRKVPGYKSVQGYTFTRLRYYDLDRKNVSIPEPEKPSKRRIGRYNVKAIRCIETGVIYESQQAACKALSVAPSQLSQHLKRRAGFKRIKGHTFEHCEAPAQPTQPAPIQYPPRKVTPPAQYWRNSADGFKPVTFEQWLTLPESERYQLPQH